MTARQRQHVGVELVDADRVVALAIGRQRAHAESDHAEPDRPLLLLAEDGQPHARGRRVVGARLVAQRRLRELLAVQDHAVQQAAHLLVAAAGFAHPQRAVEVALHDDDVVLQELRVAEAVVGGGQRGDQCRTEQRLALPGQPGRQRRQREQRQRQLVVGGEHARRHQAHQQPAERTAGRQAQVELRQVLRCGLALRQLAMTEQAREEHAHAVQRDRDADVEHAALGGQAPAHRHEQQQRRQQQPLLLVPAATAAALEGQHEGQQVQRQRHHPQERHAGDVLRDVAGGGDQHQRAERGQRQPQRIVGQRGRALVALALALGCGGQRRRAASLPGAGRAGGHEQRIGAAPHPALRGAGGERFDRERKRQQADQRAEVAEREQPVHGLLGEARRDPLLQQRAGGRQQEVRQADGGGQQNDDAQRRVFLAGRLEQRIGNDRQERQAHHQQRDVQRALGARRPPRQPVRVRIAGQQRDLEEHHAGGPHRRGPAEPRQDLLGDDRLHQEQQEGGQQDRRGKKRHRSGAAGSVGRRGPGRLRVDGDVCAGGRGAGLSHAAAWRCDPARRCGRRFLEGPGAPVCMVLPAQFIARTAAAARLRALQRDAQRADTTTGRRCHRPRCPCRQRRTVSLP